MFELQIRQASADHELIKHLQPFGQEIEVSLYANGGDNLQASLCCISKKFVVEFGTNADELCFIANFSAPRPSCTDSTLNHKTSFAHMYSFTKAIKCFEYKLHLRTVREDLSAANWIERKRCLRTVLGVERVKN